MNYDIFNGDADGICALTQLRNAEPRESVLVTGVKRDIELLQQVDAGEGDLVAVAGSLYLAGEIRRHWVPEEVIIETGQVFPGESWT